MAFFLHPHTPRLLPSYPYDHTSATGLVMKRIRFQDDESSAGSIAVGVTLGALAGFVVGVVVAQKVGGFAGLSARIRERFETFTHRGKETESGGAATYGDDLDEDYEEEIDDGDDFDSDAEGDSALEEGVLR